MKYFLSRVSLSLPLQICLIFSSQEPQVKKAPVFIRLHMVANTNKQFLEAKQQSPTDKSLSFSILLNKYKWQITGLLLASAWAIIQLKLFFLERELTKKNGWSNWNKHKSLEQLYSQREAESIKELCLEIKSRYGTNSQAAIQFLEHVKQEENALTFHYKISQALSKAWLTKLFWLNMNLSNTKEDRLTRLSFFKALLCKSFF